MASINRHLPSPGSAVWRRDISPRDEAAVGGSGGLGDANKVRHVVIRDAEIREQPSPHVVYRIDVLTEQDHWYLYHRYSHFYSLHKKLMRQHNVGRDLLPPKKLSGNLSKQLIDKRRHLLESYLQKMIHSEAQISQSTELLEFLDVPTHDVIRVTDILTRHLYRYGDQMLEEGTPIALSVNEMYSITKRLQLPFDASSAVDSSDLAADLAHLYGFIHQLRSLRISPPPPPSSICCSNFDINPFRSLTLLKLDRIPLSQINGLVALQQQLKKLTVHRSLHSLKELLIDAVEDKRGVAYGVGGAYWSEGTPPPSPTTDKWRLTATAKLIGSRVVVQPWHQLTTLVLSHNLLTHLDDSLQVLPALKELNLSHNQLQVVHLQHLCLPSLEKLNLSHNCIYEIQHDKKVLERITKLNLSHNRLQSLDGIKAFVGVATLQLSYNLLSSRSDLYQLVDLRSLTSLTLAGNPISSTNACRLILLAKFLQRSRLITLDGLEVTSKEQAKIQSLKDRYGNNPDTWPITKALIATELSSSQTTPPSPPSLLKPARIEQGPVQNSPKMSLSWTIHSPAGAQRRPFSPPRSMSMSSTDSPNLSQSARQAPPTTSDRHSSLITHFPKSFDHLTLTQSSDDPKEHAIFAHSLVSSKTSGDMRGREGRSGREMSPPEEDLVAGRARKTAGYYHSRFRDNSLVSLPDSREEPDGQSDISSLSPDAVLLRRESTPDTPVEMTDTPSICSLTPPPSTPLTANGNSFKSTITPTMIQSALSALQQIQDKDTPISTGGTDEGGHSPIFPEEVTSALTAWISQQHGSSRQRSATSSEIQTPLLSPPPSTPQKPESESDSVSAVVNLEGSGAAVRHGISASDLIAALSSLIGQDSTDAASGESSRSGMCSVPACTPKEGFTDWLRLGIHPDEVIQALTALTISRGEQEGEGGVEGPKVTRPSQFVTKYEEFAPSVVISDTDIEIDRREKEKEEDLSDFAEGEKVELEGESFVDKDQSQQQTATPCHEDEGAEKEKETARELVSDQQQQVCQKTIDLSTAPVVGEVDIASAASVSDEAMGIQLLNELSFFPDPLSTTVPQASDERDSSVIDETVSLSTGIDERGSCSGYETIHAVAPDINERGSLSGLETSPAAAPEINERGSRSGYETTNSAAPENAVETETNLSLTAKSFEEPSSPLESVLYSDTRDFESEHI